MEFQVKSYAMKGVKKYNVVGTSADGRVIGNSIMYRSRVAAARFKLHLDSFRGGPDNSDAAWRLWMKDQDHWRSNHDQ